MEVLKQDRVRGDLDAYICGYIDGELTSEEIRTLSGYLKRNPEAKEYFTRVVRGSRLLQGLPVRKASCSLEAHLTLSINNTQQVSGKSG